VNIVHRVQLQIKHHLQEFKIKTLIQILLNQEQVAPLKVNKQEVKEEIKILLRPELPGIQFEEVKL
jgi:hypothetical protein